MQNATCLGKMMFIFNRQHFTTVEAQFIKKLSNAKTELTKSLAYKKECRVY